MRFFRNYVIIIILLSIIPLANIFFTSHLPHTSDGGVHVPRIAAFVTAIADQHIPVRWAGNINYTYGLPLFNFIYHFPYIVATIFVSFGASLILSFKLVLLTSYILSGVFMYAFSKEFFQNQKQAFLITIFYQFSPFRLVELLVRASIGEIYVYTFFPLVLYGILKLSKKISPLNIGVTSIATFLLIISHNSLSVTFFALSLLFTIMVIPKSRWIVVFISVLLGLSLASYYWIPAIAEHKYTYGDLFMKDLYKQHFPPMSHLILPNFFDDSRLRVAEVNVSIGLFHLCALILSLIYLFKKHTVSNRVKSLFYFSLTATTGALFLMNPISLSLWEHISFLRQFQFPWRLLSILCFSTAIFSVSYINIVKNKFMYLLLIFLAIFTTSYYWKPPQGYTNDTNEQFWSYPLNTTYFGETDVIWSGGEATHYPTSPIQVIEGDAEVKNIQKKTAYHQFIVNSLTDSRIVDNTTYFPGWRVYDDSTKIPIEFQDQNWRGLITFRLAKGIHRITVRFEESPIRTAADSISIASVFLLLFLMQFYKKVFKYV